MFGLSWEDGSSLQTCKEKVTNSANYTANAAQLIYI
jgi:hypothetical protein